MIKAILLSICTSIMIFISGPQWSFSLLALVWMIPLQVAIQNTSKINAFLLCLGSAFLAWILSTSWLIKSLVAFTGSSLPVALMMFIFLCLYVSIPYALYGYFYVYLHINKKAYGPWLGATIFTIIFIFYPTPLPVFPVHFLYKYPRPLQMLDVSGLSSLLFISILFQLLIVKLINKQAIKTNVIQLLLVIVLVSGYGYYRYSHFTHQKTTDHFSITLGYIQPNLKRTDDTTSLYALSRKLLNKAPKPDLLIWPEIPSDFSLIDKKNDWNQTLDLTNTFQQDLMAVSGYVYVNSQDINQDIKTYYNQVHLIKGGNITDDYSKQILVPFFEYFPKKYVPEILRHFFPHTANYTPGEVHNTFIFNDNVRIIPAVCYEIIFPNVISNFVKNGGNILINPSNDIWFGSSAGSNYHMAAGLFRTLEHNIPWLRVTNSGISVAVEASGDIVDSSQTTLNTQLVAKHTLFIPNKRTLYSKYGDWLTPTLIICLLGTLFIQNYPGRWFRQTYYNNTQ